MGLLPARDEVSTVMFGELDEPSSFAAVRTSAVALAVPLLLFNLTVLALVYRRSREERLSRAERGSEEDPARRRLRAILAGNLLSSSALATTQLVAAGMQGVPWEVCTYVGGMYAPFYILSNFFVYLCLLERAASVTDTGRWRRLLLLLVRGGTYSVAVLAIASFFMFRGRLYFRQQTCVQSVVSWIAWLSMALDTALSLALLYLFLHPVLFHLRRIPLHLENDKLDRNYAVLRRVARRNFTYSAIAIVSTILYLVAVCISTEVLAVRETPEISWLRHVQSNGIVLELFINSSMILLMASSVWMPRPLNAWFVRRFPLHRSSPELYSASPASLSALDQGAVEDFPTSMAAVPPASLAL